MPKIPSIAVFVLFLCLNGLVGCQTRIPYDKDFFKVVRSQPSSLLLEHDKAEGEIKEKRDIAY